MLAALGHRHDYLPGNSSNAGQRPERLQAAETMSRELTEISNLSPGGGPNVFITQIEGPLLPASAVADETGFAIITNLKPNGFTTYGDSYRVEH
jgi:hypothetical protein